MSGEKAITFPCFINHNHWVAVVRRQAPSGQVTSYYADDMNNTSTETIVKDVFMLSTTDPLFRPAGATWVRCHITTFLPHTGECGPRMLTHSSIMSYHNSPSENMLSSLMYPNLAFACCVWTAITILEQRFLLQNLQHFLKEHSATQEIPPITAAGITHSLLSDNTKSKPKNRNKNSDKHSAGNLKRQILKRKKTTTTTTITKNNIRPAWARVRKTTNHPGGL